MPCHNAPAATKTRATFLQLTLVALLCALALPMATARAAAPSVYLEDLTSTEVAEQLRQGHRTVIIPVGGVEQNGAHMALGKHNFRAHRLAGRIATGLGNALVAPVVGYVPEGDVSPPSGHMRFAGTISIPEAAFSAVLDGAAQSLAQHGFTDVVLLGDSGNYQTTLKAVADGLNRRWKGKPLRAHFIAEYYQAAQQPFRQVLRERGLTEADMGQHAGAADTALMWALDDTKLRPAKMAAASPGVNGDPARASAALGQLGVDLIVQRTVAAIRKATSR
jgi:creatinine amidohydrolase